MTTHDVIIIGGGPAGLQAAMSFGRIHRDVVVLDSGSYRNDRADAMHNVIGHDGDTPEEFRAAARKDISAYSTVELRDTAALDVAGDGSGFVVRTADDELTARHLLLATGMRDELLPVPGLDELFGTVAAHCPYCHGHEFSGGAVGLLGSGEHTLRVALLMERIASSLVVLANDTEIDAEVRAKLEAHGVAIRPEPVTRLERTPAGVRAVLDGGPDEEVGGLMVGTKLTQSAPFAEQLGLDLQESGCVAVDQFGRTSRAGVYAAGDMAHVDGLPGPVSSVLAAAAAGSMAAAAIDGDLIAD